MEYWALLQRLWFEYCRPKKEILTSTVMALGSVIMLCLKALQELGVSWHFLLFLMSFFWSARWGRPWNALSCPVKRNHLCKTSVRWLWPCREWMLNAPQKSWLSSHWKKEKKGKTYYDCEWQQNFYSIIEMILWVYTVASVGWNTCRWRSRGKVLILSWCWGRLRFLLRSFPILCLRCIWVFSSFNLFTELVLPICTFTIQRESDSTFTSYGNTNIRALKFQHRCFLTEFLNGSCYWFCFEKDLHQ